MQLNRREFTAGLLSSAFAIPQPLKTHRPPNILFILADDMGYGDLSCFGQQKFSTPNIDRLAAEGLRFTDAYTGGPVCAPSRCSLMTGKNTGHARIRENTATDGKRVSLTPDDVTVAELLKKAGYKTGIVGKWGIGEAGSWGVPNYKGFDEWFGFLNQDDALHYYPETLWNNMEQFIPKGNQGAKREDYAQKMFTDRAKTFIRDHQSEPFFLYLPYTVPHPDSELGRDTKDGYVVPDYGPFKDKDWPVPEKGYAEMIKMLDDDVGSLMDLLKELGIESNTLVIFASDNGSGTEGGHHPKFFHSNGVLRGEKGTLYEGAIRTPVIARWKGQISPGRTSDAPWAFCDFMPTAVELAGVPVSVDTDGESIVPLLREEKAAHRKRPLYWEDYKKGDFLQAVRLDSWKAIRVKSKAGNRFELYDLASDPSESHDVSAQHPDIVAAIEKIMQADHTDSPSYWANP